MKIIKDIEQGSQDWLDLRLGKITASRVADIMSNGRGGKPSLKTESYMNELISEILTGAQAEFFTNAAMAWGNECEPQARAMYELQNNVDVEEVAFIQLNDHVGVSPDGLVGEDGLLEIKCPTSKKQIERALSDSYHADYKAQIQMQLYVSGRNWCDFVSFDPRIEGNASYLQEQVYRDEDYIKEMEYRIINFIACMDDKLAKLK